MRAIAFLTLLGMTLTGLLACGGNKAGNAARTAASAAGAVGNAAQGAMGAVTGKPDCGATQPVWVNLNTKVYHEPGDPAYGHTRHGEYLCPSQAVAQGFRKAGEGGGAGGRHHRRHHRRAGIAPEAAPTSTY